MQDHELRFSAPPSPQAPVFSKLPRLPAILGQFVHTAPLFSE